MVDPFDVVLNRLPILIEGQPTTEPEFMKPPLLNVDKGIGKGAIAVAIIRNPHRAKGPCGIEHRLSGIQFLLTKRVPFMIGEPLFDSRSGNLAIANHINGAKASLNRWSNLVG